MIKVTGFWLVLVLHMGGQKVPVGKTQFFKTVEQCEQAAGHMRVWIRSQRVHGHTFCMPKVVWRKKRGGNLSGNVSSDQRNVDAGR